MFRTSYRIRKRMRVIALMCSLPLTLWTQVGPASAQSLFSSQQKKTLQEAGFTPADFKAAEQTQIAPHHARYQSWLRCTVPTLGVLIDRDLDADSAAKLAFADCRALALELRASIARSLGLPQAERVVKLLYAGIILVAVQRWDAKHPGQTWIPRQVGNWIISSKKDGMCAATLRAPGTDKIILAFVNVRGALTLHLTSQRAGVPSTAYEAMREITIVRPSAPYRTSLRFTVAATKDNGPNSVSFEGVLDSASFEALRDATAIILHSPAADEATSYRGEERFTLETPAAAVDAMRAC